jgi:hypothetical protein
MEKVEMPILNPLIPAHPEAFSQEWVPVSRRSFTPALMHRTFPEVPPGLQKQLQVDPYTYACATPQRCGMLTAIKISERCKHHFPRSKFPSLRVVDCSAGGSGNMSLYFAMIFGSCVSVEYDVTRLANLRHNLNIMLPCMYLSPRDVTCVHGDSSRYGNIQAVDNANVAFYSPTWDIPKWYAARWQNNIYMGYGPGKREITDVCIEAIEKAKGENIKKLVFVHLPSTYNFTKMKRKLRAHRMVLKVHTPMRLWQPIMDRWKQLPLRFTPVYPPRHTAHADMEFFEPGYGLPDINGFLGNHTGTCRRQDQMAEISEYGDDEWDELGDEWDEEEEQDDMEQAAHGEAAAQAQEEKDWADEFSGTEYGSEDEYDIHENYEVYRDERDAISAAICEAFESQRYGH